MNQTPSRLQALFSHIGSNWTIEQAQSSLDGWWTLTMNDGERIRTHRLVLLGDAQLGWHNTSDGFDYADLSEIASAERIDTTLTDEQRARISARRAERQRRY